MMQKLENDILQKFLDIFIQEMKKENDDRNRIELSDINIPFVLSSLYQSFSNDIHKYKEFIQDLKDYPDYNIVIEESKNDYNGIIDVSINLVRESEQYDCNAYIIDCIYPDYSYLIVFTYEDRDYGYCQCTSDMPDYREDKHCCGHGCDASFCSFSLHKVLNIVSDSWNGDEYDYWEFEDEFYASDKELADKKAEEDKIRMIEELKNRIEADQKKLAELEGA